MRSTNYLVGALLACGLSLLAPAITNAAPLTKIISRKVGIDGMGFASIILAVIDYLKGSNAYDPNTPDKCVISMYTTSGGNCETYIQCDESDEAGIDLSSQWTSCFLGGRQYFTDPHIGDFSITFSKAGGKDGDTEDGLHTPILQLADVNNWDPLDVEATAQRAIDHDAGNLCKGNYGGAGTQRLGWICGVPTIGKSGFGLDSNTAVQTSGYAPGWCTFHIVQYQRNEYGIGADYAFDVLIFDNNKTPIGQVSKAPIDPATKGLGVDSNLPLVLVLWANGGDADPVKFAYGAQSWDSNDRTVHQSNMDTTADDGYENGSRQGDMGFNC